MERRLGFVLAILVALLVQPALAESKIFVASSLVDVVEGLVDASGITGISVVTGSSSSLARQIKAGAPADLFISANREWAEFVAGDQVLSPLFSNRLVLISHADMTLLDPFSLSEKLGRGRLALGDPEHVPAGIYAREALEYLGLWSDLQNRLAPADNVRATARLVQTGAAPFGIVYASDAQLLELNVVYEFEAQTHSPITYWAVILDGEKQEIAAFVQFLGSDAARAIVASYGFMPFEGQ